MMFNRVGLHRVWFSAPKRTQQDVVKWNPRFISLLWGCLLAGTISISSVLVLF